MSKIAIVKFSQISEPGGNCISARRFIGSCHECHLVMKCRISQARDGRIKFHQEAIISFEKQIADLKQKIDAAREQIAKE